MLIDGSDTWLNLSNSGIYSGTTTNTLTLTAAYKFYDKFKFRCVVSNATGNVTSEEATLTVNLNLFVTFHPQNTAIKPGQNAMFSVAATSNSAEINYIWQVNILGAWVALEDGPAYSGTETATLNVKNASIDFNGVQFRCTVVNGEGFISSNPATLTVSESNVAPSITSQPTYQSITAGQSTDFSVSATGMPVPTYQWQVSAGGSSWSNITNGGIYSGATSNTLILTGAEASYNNYRYRCIISNVAGSVTSNSAMLTVTTSGGENTAPTITTQPANKNITAGQNTTFSITATGTPSPTYKWQLNLTGVWIDLTDGDLFSGTKTLTLTLTNVTIIYNGAQFRCVATNSQGTATSNNATLTVSGGIDLNFAPEIITDPIGITVNLKSAQSAIFIVVAAGLPLPTYQWQIYTDNDWEDIVNNEFYSGAGTATLMLSGIQKSYNKNQYRCVVKNSEGSATSAAVTLTVDGGGLSGGAIARIVLGSVAIAGAAGFAAWFFLIRKKRI